MRAGRLRKRMQIQVRVPTTDAEGASSDVWTTVGSVWAELQPLSSQEQLQGAQEEQISQMQVNIRYSPTLSIRPNHNTRLLLGSRILDITDVSNVPNERNRELQLIAVERVR